MHVLSAFIFAKNAVILQSRNTSFEGFLMQAGLFNGTIVGAFQLQNLSMLQYSSCSTSQVCTVYIMHVCITLHCLNALHCTCMHAWSIHTTSKLFKIQGSVTHNSTFNGNYFSVVLNWHAPTKAGVGPVIFRWVTQCSLLIMQVPRKSSPGNKCG